MAILFVSNGHGEAAIAGAIARALPPGLDRLDHFPLVGEGFALNGLQEVGPRRTLPSGGLVAMLNVRNLARDLAAGLAGLVLAQAAFLRAAHRRYQLLVAVGDTYGLAMALLARRPVLFVGTAKSEYVAPYVALERRVLRAARQIFVRDDVTAAALARYGLRAAAANVIADLPGEDTGFPWPAAERIAVLPGSRAPAYGDAVLLARVVRAAAADRPALTAAMSVAPSIQGGRLAAGLAADGWQLTVGLPASEMPFTAAHGGRTLLQGWRGSLGAVLKGATLVLGQAGTANEAAAAAGVPVVALETLASKGSGWYRMRQARLLGAGLLLVPEDPAEAARQVGGLLDDPARRAAMGAAGRARMGAPGGAATIAAAITALAEAA